MPAEEIRDVFSYRWVVLVAFMFIGALTQLMWLSYAPIMKETEHLMGASEFKILLLMTMFPLLYVPVSVPAGIVIDRKGFRFAVMIGALCTAAFSFLRVFAGSYPLVLLGMIGIAIGQPFVLNSITKMVSTWFPSEESATATGLASLSMFLGMIIAYALLPVFYKASGGPALAALEEGSANMSTRPLAAVALLFSLVAVAGLIFFALFAKARPPWPPVRTEQELVADTTAIHWGSLRAIFALHNFRILCLVIFIGNGCFVGILQLLEKIMLPKGISATTSSNIGTVMVVSGVVGCVVIPALSDKIMKRKPFLILAAAMSVPLLLIIGGASNTVVIFLSSGLLGFFLFSALPVLLTFSEEDTGAHLTGTATSVILLLGNAGGVIITLLMEAIKSTLGGPSGSFGWSLVFTAVLFGIALVFGLRLHEGARPIPAEEAEPVPTA